MNDRINRACDDALAAIDRAMPEIDRGSPTIDWSPVRLHRAQRFDRDAVKAMLVDAINEAANHGGAAALDGLDNLWIGGVHSIDADVLADNVIRWFGKPLAD